MRTFVALNLPPAERDRLHASLEPLRARSSAVRWTGADALHVTVKFLGDTPADGVDRIESVLRGAGVRRAPIALRIAGIGAFPSLRRANIVWVGVSGGDELTALQRELDPALTRLGFPRDARPFRPHITVGRTRGDARPPDITRLAPLVEHEATVLVHTIDLMRSRPGPGGSRYDTLLSCPLGEEAA